jgi:hypothetical protein|tara:strand:+ start:824 stop:1438 length:615 start_codon:yes stop_codon:yes gene_type:complete
MKLNEIYKKIDAMNEAVNMSISMSGETADDVATLMKMVKDAGGKPEIIPPMPKMSPRDDIEKSLKVMDLPPAPKKMPMDMEPGCEDEVAKEGDWDNSPDEKYQDTAYMQNDLAGGLNRQKKSYPKVAGGDNPMALEDEIKSELRSKLESMMSEDKKKKNESGCVGEMKRLDANGCTKEEMKKKITAEYDVDDAKFEKLYASNCG